jgi:hypothetical protein
MRLSPEAIRHLVCETDPSAIIVTSRSHAVAEEALQDKHDTRFGRVKLFKSVPFDQFLVASNSTARRKVQLPRSDLIQEDDRNVIILHSSGTTGNYLETSTGHIQA